MKFRFQCLTEHTATLIFVISAFTGHSWVAITRTAWLTILKYLLSGPKQGMFVEPWQRKVKCVSGWGFQNSLALSLGWTAFSAHWLLQQVLQTNWLRNSGNSWPHSRRAWRPKIQSPGDKEWADCAPWESSAVSWGGLLDSMASWAGSCMTPLGGFSLCGCLYKSSFLLRYQPQLLFYFYFL